MTTTLRRKLNNLTFPLVWLVLIAGLFVTLYWQLQEDPLTVTGEVTAIHTKPGKQVTFVREVCNYRLTSVEIQRSLVSSDEHLTIMLPSVYYGRDILPGNCANIRFFLDIPNKIPPGSYYYRPYAVYNINPIRVIEKDLPGLYLIITE
jgi:hypothetical protein